MSLIRHLAISGNNALLAAAEFESTVHLFDLNSLETIRTINTTLDFGGRRLDLSPDGAFLATGAYARNGIAVYRTSDGSESWRRKDRKRVQNMRFSSDGRHVICSFDDKACVSLDASSGRSGASWKGIRNFWVNRIGHLHLLERSKEYLLASSQSTAMTLPKISFACLDAAFSPSAVCITEAANAVRLFDIKTGELRWQWNPTIGYGTCIKLAYKESSDEFIGVMRAPGDVEDYILCRFDRNSGKATSFADVGEAYCCEFYGSGELLITASGAIIDTNSGSTKARLDFGK